MSARTLSTVIMTLAVVMSMFAGGIALPTQAGHSESVQTSDTVRVTDINRAQSTVNTGDDTSLRFRIENTGKDDVTVQPDITVNGGEVVDYHKSPNPTNAPSFQIDGESSIVVRVDVVFTQESDSGTTSVEIGLNNSPASQEYTYTVDDSATTYNSSLESTGKRQDISKYITSYKDERGDSANQNYDESIPPVKQTSSGYESDASGEVRQFTNAREENGEPVTLDSVNDRLKVGFHVDNVPTESHYSMKFNYRVTQGSGVLVNVVKSDGTLVDNNTTYELGSTDRKTTYFRLSEKEQEYISSQNQVYLVFENINSEQTSIDIFSSKANSADRPITTEVPQYTNLELSTNKDQYTTGETIQINGEYDNKGSHYRTQTVDLLRNGNLVNRKQVTVAPGKTNTFSFSDSVERSGIYEYRIDNTSKYVQVGSGSGTSGNATAVISLDESEENNRSEMGDAYTEDAIFIDAAGVYHIDTDQDVILNSSNSYHTHPNKNIDSYSWSQTGSGFDGETITNPVTGREDSYRVSWTENGTKQVELTAEGSDGSTSTTKLTVRVGSTSPDAKYTYQPQPPVVGQDIDFDALESSHPTQDDDSLTYEWDFDDGTTTTTQSEIVRHEYDSSGTYTVTVTVSDQYGNTDTRTKTVTVESSEIVPDFVYSPFEPNVGETVTFNGEESEAKTDGESIVEYNWDVNGTTYNDAGSQITHEFESEGQHPVTLEVVTNSDNTETVTKNVDVVGKQFTVITEDEYKKTGSGQPVEFDATPTQDPENQIEEWKWEFGDGTVIPYGEAGPKEIHSYENQDVYEATVYARGKGFEGNDTVTVNVTDEPVADAGDDKTKEWVDTFTVDGGNSYAVGDDNEIEEYKWEMGDGTTYTNEEPTQDHQYDEPGTYEVTLTVTDSTGKTDSDTAELTYTKKPPVAMITDFATDDREDNINGTDKEVSLQQDLELYGEESYEPSEPSEPIHKYTWEMDDGTTYFTENITHKFESAGTYNVTLTVEDEYGNTDTTNVNVTVIDGIKVDYEINDTYTHHRTTEQKQRNVTESTLSPNYEYNFNASKTDDTSGQKEYRWDMDDGTTFSTTSETITHEYTEGGTYEPYVEVYVNGEYVGEDTETVSVESETKKEVYYKYGEEKVSWQSSMFSNSGVGNKSKWNSRLWMRTNATENSSTRQYRTGNKVNLTEVDSIEVEYEIEQGREVDETTINNGDTVRTFDVSNSYSAYAELSGAGGAQGTQSDAGYGGYVNGAMRTASYDSISVHVGDRGYESLGLGGEGRHNGGRGGETLTYTAGGGGASTELYLPTMDTSNFVLVADGGGGSGAREYDVITGLEYCAGGGGGARGGAGATGNGDVNDNGTDGEGEGYGGDGGSGNLCGYPNEGQPGGYEINYNYIPSTPTTITSGEVGGGEAGGESYAQDAQSGKAVVQLYNGYEEKRGDQGTIVVDINGTEKNVSISGTENYSTGRIRVDTSDIEGKEHIKLQTYGDTEGDGTVETKITKVQGTYTPSSYAYITDSSADSSRDDNINGSTKTIQAGDEVTLFGEHSYASVGSITKYTWDMDDGTTYSTENITHTFEEQGTHDVTLTVEDEYGVTDTARVTVEVENAGGFEENESGWSSGDGDSDSNWNHTDNGTLKYEEGFNSQNYSYNVDSDTSNGHELHFEVKLPNDFSESAKLQLRNDSTGKIAAGEVENDAYNNNPGKAVLQFAGNTYRDGVNGDWEVDEWVNATVYYDPKNGECRLYAEQESSGKAVTIDRSSEMACQTGNAADDVDEIRITGWSDSGDGIEYRNISVKSYDSSS